MFPAGSPGVALLLLRLSVAATPFIDEHGHFSDLPPGWMALALFLVASLLIVGFVTPVLAVFCGMFKVLSVWALGGTLAPIDVLVLLEAAAVALLGPGAYSLDARLFGRRVVA